MNSKFAKIALAESLIPVHPGEPGKAPFWNIHAQRAIYAPAFDFEEVSTADFYRFRLISGQDSSAHMFEADKPWAALTPVWESLLPGRFKLTVEAIDGSADTLIKIAGKREFLKSSPFRGVENQPARDYAESGMRCLKDLMYQERFQTWLHSGQPNQEYPLWVHPTKIVGAVIASMSFYAASSPRPEDAGMAIQIAIKAAKFLLSLCEPEGRSLEFWPPSYWDGVPRESHPIYMTQIMSNYPAEGALAFLDLYDATGDSRYFDAGYKIAKTYLRLQRADGTWPQLFDIQTAKAVGKNLLIPVMVIKLFDRLDVQYEVTECADAREKAFQWCLDHPLKTYNWQAQFEDTRPKSAYKNMSRAEVVEMAVLMLQDVGKNPEYLYTALELLRFAEDLFVIWNADDPVLFTDWFPQESHWSGFDPEKGKDWFLPCVLEQFKFYTPISRSNSTMTIAYLKAFEATGEKIYLAKAVALANTLTIAQQHHGGGEIPTHLRKTLPEQNWLNCAVYPAMTLIRYSDVLNDY